MQLKIRGWDTDEQKMVYNLEDMVGNTLNHYLLVQNEDNSIAIMREGDGNVLPTDVWIGQHDMVRREIFTKDIVTFVTNEEYDGGRHHLTAEVCYDDSDAGFYFHTTHPQMPYIKPYFAENVTVIGNTHQNPELMKFPEFKTVKPKKKRVIKP